MKQHKENDKEIFYLSVLLPLVVATAFWFGRNTKEIADEPDREDMLFSLQRRLDKAVADEKYELAAKLRDKINTLREQI